jgi:hypothetical protein
MLIFNEARSALRGRGCKFTDLTSNMARPNGGPEMCQCLTSHDIEVCVCVC